MKAAGVARLPRRGVSSGDECASPVSNDGADARRRPAQHLCVPAGERAGRAGRSSCIARPMASPPPMRATKIDCTRAWLPNPAEPMRGSILRGWQSIVAHGYAAVYQDSRGRHGSEGEDRVYADDAADGHDTLEWIAGQPWTNQRVGMSGSSAGATTDLRRGRRPGTRACAPFSPRPAAPASMTTSSMKASRSRWSGCGCGSRATSRACRRRIARRSCGASGSAPRSSTRAAVSAAARYARLDAARHADPPFVESADWLRLPLTNYPDFATWQPFLDEIISHPAPDRVPRRPMISAARSTSPAFTSRAGSTFFRPASSRRSRRSRRAPAPRSCGSARTSIISSMPTISGRATRISNGSAIGSRATPSCRSSTSRPVFYSPRAWVDDRAGYVADDWRHAERWPPPGTTPQRLYLCGDGSLSARCDPGPGGAAALSL